MYGIKTEMNEKLNANLVNNAQEKLEQGELNKSKELFEESKQICVEQNWTEGINYAVRMIEEIEEKIDPFEKLTEAGFTQPIGEPQQRKTKETYVMVDVGSEAHPFMVTNEENAVMEKFKEEYPRKKTVHLGKPTKAYQEWKTNNVTV